MNDRIYEVIKENEKLIYKIAAKFYGIDIEDLYQVGVIGLIKAFRNFNSDGTAKFSTYAYDYIFGEMYNLSLLSRNIKINKETLQLCKKIEEARSSLSQTLGYIPSNKEVARFLEIDELVINDTWVATAQMLSLDEEGEVKLHETIPDKHPLKIDERIIIDESMATLNDNEKDIIKCRYFNDFTQSETATALGMTQASVSRYEKACLEKMNDYMSLSI